MSAEPYALNQLTQINLHSLFSNIDETAKELPELFLQEKRAFNLSTKRSVFTAITACSLSSYPAVRQKSLGIKFYSVAIYILLIGFYFWH